MSVLALCGGTAFSQSQLDAFKYSQTELNGTARYLGMGGAFGALGGDISAMNTNPAGLAIYKSSEVVTTLSLSSASAKTDWLGSKVDNSRTKVSFDNIAYVGYFPTANDEGIVSRNQGKRKNQFFFNPVGKIELVAADDDFGVIIFVDRNRIGFFFALSEAESNFSLNLEIHRFRAAIANQRNNGREFHDGAGACLSTVTNRRARGAATSMP